MKKIVVLLFISIFSLLKGEEMTIYDFEAKSIDGKNISFEKYRGKTLLIVNVASKCGFTNQYEGLETLYKTYKDRGLEVLGFPCNQFAHQEPNDNEQIKNFCELTFGVTFDMFSKVDVNGEDAHPIYKFLKEKESGFLGTEAIKWNFTKFLVNNRGEVIKRYAPVTTPKEIEVDIESILKK